MIERLLRIVERQLLVLLTDTDRTDLVARLETVEDRHAEVQTDILREVVLELGTEAIRLKARGGVIVRAETTAQRERRIVASLRNLDAVLSTFQLQLLREDLRLDAEGLSVDSIGGEIGVIGVL